MREEPAPAVVYLDESGEVAGAEIAAPVRPKAVRFHEVPVPVWRVLRVQPACLRPAPPDVDDRRMKCSITEVHAVPPADVPDSAEEAPPRDLGLILWAAV